MSLRKYKHSHNQTKVSLWSLFKNTTWTMSNQSFYFQSGILAANLWPIISLMNSFQMSTFLWMLKVSGAHKKGSFVLKIPLLWPLNLCTKSVKTPSCNEIFYGSFAFVTYLDTNWGYTCFIPKSLVCHVKIIGNDFWNWGWNNCNFSFIFLFHVIFCMFRKINVLCHCLL